MKKTISYALLFISICIITGCSKETYKVTFQDDTGEIPCNEVTYKFTGFSEHFSFSTGKAYYGDNNERYLLIKNFKNIKAFNNQNNIAQISIDLFFNNEELYSNTLEIFDEKNIDYLLKEENIEELGKYSPDGWGEIDSFTKTKKSDFKDAIKIVITYCYNDDKCTNETMHFDFY